MGFLKDLFYGKLKTEEADLQIVKAIATDKNGKKYTFTRYGRIEWWLDSPYEVTGSELIYEYMSISRREILVDDDGNMLPVCNINSIEKVITPNIVKYSYR